MTKTSDIELSEDRTSLKMFVVAATSGVTLSRGLKRVVGRNSIVKKGKYATMEFDEEGAIIVNVGDQRCNFFPAQLLSTVIRNVKNGIQRYQHESCVKAVITVPICFTYSQRRALVDCCTMEEVQVIGIITDPIAAVIACELHKKANASLVLIFSLGGGTLEVTVVSVGGGNLIVKSTSGDTQVGGDEFDSRLVRYFAQKFTQKYGVDPSKDKTSLWRLRTACETAKCQLTSKPEVTVKIDSFFEDIDFVFTISRALFTELCSDLFFAVERHTQNALRDAGVQPKDINHVILVGGGTHIPRIHQFLGDFFGEDKFFPNVDPEEVIVRGAAMQAELLAKNSFNVTPLSIRIEDSYSGIIAIIPRDTPLPITESIVLANQYPARQRTVRIYEGERSLSKCNYLLGVLDLNEITSNTNGISQIHITIEINSFGYLDVTAENNYSGKFIYERIPTSKGCLTAMEVEKILQYAEEHRETEYSEQKRLEARNNMERCIEEMKLFAPVLWNSCIDSVRKLEIWLENNLHAEKDIYDYKVTQLQSMFLHNIFYRSIFKI